MPLFLCDREFVSDQRWRVDMNEFYEELKKVLDLSDGDVWTETVLCGKDAGKEADSFRDFCSRRRTK